MLNIPSEKYNRIISFLSLTMAVYIFLLRGDGNAGIGRGETGRNSGFSLFAVNVTTCLIKAFSSSLLLILREKELREGGRCGKGKVRAFCVWRGGYFDRMGDGG